MKHQTVVLIDGNNLAFRNYHTRRLSTSAGVGTGAIYGVLQSTRDILEKRGEETELLYFWEGGLGRGPGVIPWRRGLQGGDVYKANRTVSDDTVDIHRQINLSMKALHMLGYGQLYVPGLEADDLIGMVSARLASMPSVGDVYIYSTDRDFFQCISDSVLVMRPEGKGNERTIRTIKAKDVKKEFGVWPDEWAKYKALVGDPSDNYKGLPGCGPKGAAVYLSEGLDPSLPRFDQQPNRLQKKYPALKYSWQDIYISYQLAYIPRIPNYPLFPKVLRKAAEEQVRESPRMLVRRMTREKLTWSLARFTTFCADYELNSILAERRKFFSTVEVIDEVGKRRQEARA